MKPITNTKLSIPVKSPIRDFSREQLFHRHRLSHQQIDDVLEESQAKLFLEDKLEQLRSLGVFLEVADRLKEEGVNFMNFKGPLLSYRIYGDPTYRYYKDFDILVSREEVGRVIVLIENLGFIPSEYPWPKATSRQNDLIDLVSHFSLYHPVSGVNIEVHWKLFHQPIIDENKMDLLIATHTEEMHFQGRTFKVLKKEMELLYLIIHGSKHAWFRLKWLLDVAEFLKRIDFDRDMFIKLTETLKLEKMVSLTNALLIHYFNLEKVLANCIPPSNFLVEFAKARIDDQEEKPYQDFKSFGIYLQYKINLHSFWKYRLGLMKLSTLPPAVVHHPWWSLKTLPVIGFKVLEKLKLV